VSWVMSENDAASRLPTPGKLTYEDYVNLPEDGRRYEILDGKLAMTPSPGTRHQIVSGNLATALTLYVKAYDLGTVLHAPIDVILDDTTVVVPDIVFVSKARRHLITERAIEGAPDLIIEILSPTTERRDRGTKMKLYARFAVAHYWLVDPEQRPLELYELRNGTYELVQTCKRSDTVLPALFPGFAIELAGVWT
jgi:Uma2 family endonuclease